MFNLSLFGFLETQRLGHLLGEYLPRGSVVFLSGNLGAGKTTLVQGIGEGLGIQESIISPTFTLINEYIDGRIPLYHLDLYRLQPSQVDSIYPEMYWEGIEVEPGITAVEWWQHLAIKPKNYIEIELVTRENWRIAKIEQRGTDNYDLKFLHDFKRSPKQ